MGLDDSPRGELGHGWGQKGFGWYTQAHFDSTQATAKRTPCRPSEDLADNENPPEVAA